MWGRTIAVCGLAGAPVIMARVYAADSDPAAKAEAEKQKCRPTDLPLYDQPKETEVEYVEEQVTPFQQRVSSVRQVVWTYLDSIQDTTNKVKGKWNTAKKYTDDFQTYIKEDKGAIPRAGIITVAGLGGLVAGYKGGMFRKLLFTSGAVIGATSLCYPHQAVDVANRGWAVTADQAKELWQQTRQSGKPAGVKPSQVPEAKPTEAAIKVEEVAKEAKTEPVKSSSNVDKDKKSEQKVLDKNSTTAKGGKAQKDFGQSKKEDQDMYTTRTG